MKKIMFFLLSPLLAGCLGHPAGVQPVSDFQLQPYLGKWYEIARLDHSFERAMINVTAEYSLRADGGVEVRNRGYSTKNNKWKEAVGKAYFVGDESAGHLKVSFFGPFYGSYVVFNYDPNEYAFVCGPDTSYLWLLSRRPRVSDQLKHSFIEQAEKNGFDSSQLIWVDQSGNEG